MSERLDGWKAIANHFGKTVRTIQRWEREQGLPVLRHLHSTHSTVYADSVDLDAWHRSRLPHSKGSTDQPKSASGIDAVADDVTLCAMSRHYWAQRSADALNQSIALAHTALRRNASSAAAYATLARTHATRASYGQVAPEEDARLAKDYAARAIALDPKVTEAHQALAFIRLAYDWDWKGAKEEFDIALRLDRDHATTYQWFSVWHLAQGSDEAAYVMSRHAEALAPRTLILPAHTAWMLHFAGKMEEAIATARSIIQRDPHFWRGYFNLGLSLAATGHNAEAAEVMDIGRALNDQTNFTLAYLNPLAKSGQTRSAGDLLDEKRQSGRYVSPYWEAFALMGLGEHGEALEALQRSVVQREWFLLFLAHDPVFKDLRTSSTFQDICRTVGLP